MYLNILVNIIQCNRQLCRFRVHESLELLRLINKSIKFLKLIFKKYTFFINALIASLFFRISTSFSFSAFSFAILSSNTLKFKNYLLEPEAFLPLAFLNINVIIQPLSKSFFDFLGMAISCRELGRLELIYIFLC